LTLVKHNTGITAPALWQIDGLGDLFRSCQPSFLWCCSSQWWKIPVESATSLVVELFL